MGQPSRAQAEARSGATTSGDGSHFKFFDGSFSSPQRRRMMGAVRLESTRMRPGDGGAMPLSVSSSHRRTANSSPLGRALAQLVLCGEFYRDEPSAGSDPCSSIS